MFTGLIQTLGRIQRIEGPGTEKRLYVSPLESFVDLKIGESISVNGICLSVEDFSRDWFLVYASEQTYTQTSISEYRAGSLVNLERALAVGEPIGGHFVNAHVDCVATVQEFKKFGESSIYGLQFPRDWSKFVVSKGSIALDGISLTVVDCAPGYLEVNIVPETKRTTNITFWEPGVKVNMEVDVIAKYVMQMLRPWQDLQVSQNDNYSNITFEFLQKHGFGS